MTQHQSVGAPYNVQGFPTIKIFGSNKKSPVDYQGMFPHLSYIHPMFGSRRTEEEGQWD